MKIKTSVDFEIEFFGEIPSLNAIKDLKGYTETEIYEFLTNLEELLVYQGYRPSISAPVIIWKGVK